MPNPWSNSHPPGFGWFADVRDAVDRQTVGQRSVPLVYTNGLGATAKAPTAQIDHAVRGSRTFKLNISRTNKDIELIPTVLEILSFRMSHFPGQSADNSPKKQISCIFDVAF